MPYEDMGDPDHETKLLAISPTGRWRRETYYVEPAIAERVVTICHVSTRRSKLDAYFKKTHNAYNYKPPFLLPVLIPLNDETNHKTKQDPIEESSEHDQPCLG